MPFVNERSPLLSSGREPGSTSESSPLLQEDRRRNSVDSRDDSSNKRRRKAAGRIRWPSLIAILSLAVTVVAVMVLGFVAPPAVKLYAENAAVIEPTGLSVESLTQDGIRARIRLNFRLDGTRVNDDTARFLGRLTTGIVRKLDTEETKLQVYLPTYDHALLGSVVVPSLTINLVDGQNTALDFVTELNPGDSNIMRKIINDWLRGELEQLKITGAMTISVRTGILPLGSHEVVESMVFEAKNIPTIPDYDIGQIKIHDVPVGGSGRMAIGANASLTVYNDYPIGLTVPSLGLDVLVPNCDPSETLIKVATAITDSIDVRPHVNITVDTVGLIEDIPEALTQACPTSDMSPLDGFMKQYLHGQDAQVFIRGRKLENTDLPDWIESLISTTAVPIGLPGRSFNDAIRNISVEDIDFKLPSPFADPNSPRGKPLVSGTLHILAALPSELQLNMSINGLLAKSDVLYQGNKFGELNLDHWQKAVSTKLPDSGDDGESLMEITARIANVPLDITDSDVFSDVLQKLLFGDDDLMLDISSLVDAKVSTAIGGLVLKEIPAKGKMPIKHIPGKSFSDLDLQMRDLTILETTHNSVRMRASVDVTNPTPYTASIPFVSAHVLTKGRLIGEVSCREVDLTIGRNTNLVVYATLDPVMLGGEDSHRVARELLSNYISGKNTTLTLRSHRGSIPSVPALGEALSKINMTVPTPRVKLPGDDDDDGDGDDPDEEPHSHFVRDAVFHIWSSTASFNLASPLRFNSIYVERINATAFYNHTEPVGDIFWDEPIKVTPGTTLTPRLPVDWSLNGVGFDKLRDALGGVLKLDAEADVDLRIGSWRETVKYTGHGIGARVRL